MAFSSQSAASSSKDEEHQEWIDLEATLDDPLNDHGNILAVLPTTPQVSQRRTWKNVPIRLIHRLIQYPAADEVQLKQTSWLDGVRGVAALGVFIFHAMGMWARIAPGWGAQYEHNFVFQLPFIRSFFCSGGYGVSVFFVVSGYVLTHKSLRWIRGGPATVPLVQSSVFSSIFRRGIRLYLPVFAITGVEMILSRFGMPPPLSFEFKAEDTFGAQAADWAYEMNKLANPLLNFHNSTVGLSARPKYDTVTWTIPLEWWGSMLCYLVLLFLTGFLVGRHIWRLSFLLLFAVFWMAQGSWHFFCFFVGMFIADLDLGLEPPSSTSPSSLAASSTPYIPACSSPLPGKRLYLVMFLVSFYIGGFPTLDATQYYAVDPLQRPMLGFAALRDMTPFALPLHDHARFWWSLSGAGIIFSASRHPFIKSLFESRFSQYLGRISFALYLVHNWMDIYFGLGLQKWALWVAGTEQPQGFVALEWSVRVAIGLIIWVPLHAIATFALAAIVERMVDAPSVWLGHWIWRKFGGKGQRAGTK